MVRKIALIGVGYIGKIHLGLLRNNPLWQVTGILDTDANETSVVTRQFGVHAFSSLEEALEASDVVDIATPSITHFDIACKAVLAGKHVFVEKPVTATLEEARELQSLIVKQGVVFQVGHVERFNPAFIAAKPYLDAPVFIEVHRLAQYNPRGTDVSVVLDLTMHDLDLITSIVDSPVKEIRVAGSAIVSAGVDLLNARLEFESGCVANITTNRMALRNSRKFRVFTRKNLVNINLLEKTTEVVRIRDARPDSAHLVIDPGSGLPRKEIIFEQPVILPSNAINEELITFHNSISSNSATRVGIDDAVRTLELAFGIEEKLKHYSQTGRN